MYSGERCAWHYATRQPVCVRWQAGRFTRLETAGHPPPDLWIAPPLVDLQVNGFAGIDFQQDHLTPDDLQVATRGLHRSGCGRYLLTLITDAWPGLMARLSHLRNLRSGSAWLQSAIAGWHIEGPFLSAEPGYCGAHDSTVMIDPTPAHIRELRDVTGLDPVLLTLAPERSGSLAAIALADSLGIRVSLGHSNASAAVLQQAVRAGATGFTHLGNACPKELDRHDNILWRVFETAGLTVGLIADGVHVSPALFRLAHRVIRKESLYYTTDAMAAAGAPPGRYTIGRLELEVGADQVVRQPGRTNFAGSALCPIDGVFRAAQMLNSPWQEVWDRFARQPAEFMALPGRLEVGQPADFCLLKLEGENQMAELQVYLGGEQVP
ncbi:MAG: N-acetylglucosamine-6-phosphate deacetylase [Chloroflexi bacterium]|nr:N-acetylglucosamine-6-phosphate deacetylase [Chloroflexota bacterium]